MVDPLFTALGLKTSHLVGGIAGGTAFSLIVGGSIRQWGVSTFVGLLTAGYLTPGAYFTVTAYFPRMADPSIEGGLGYIVGLTALFICRGILKLVEKWSKNPSIPVP